MKKPCKQQGLSVGRASEKPPSVFSSRRSNLGFGLGDHAQRLGVSIFAVAGIFPFLQAAIELLLSAWHVDLFRLQRVVG